jgi:hypothetical protein
VNKKYRSGRHKLLEKPKSFKLSLMKWPGRHEKLVQTINELYDTSNGNHARTANVSQIQWAQLVE